ncbi:MAG TPA: hypothetical protein VJU15_09385 [Gemmatimonadales bacterium]|nr:hypothetical protein [Gemmatimonadales bacterium]
MTANPEELDEPGISLVRGDAAFRFQRLIGLIPKDGLGIARRAILFALITWLPIAVWAWLQHRFTSSASSEPLLQHFGMHVRFLIALPLMIVGEAVVQMIMPRVIPYFLTSGVLPESEEGKFREVIRGVLKLRDRTLPWIFILGIGIALAVGSPALSRAHELDWSMDPATSAIGFGGLWFLYFARPLFIAVLLGWVWRVILFGVLLKRISKLELSLVPSHPDGNGGLGFLELLPAMFSPLIFALSAMMASYWSHQILYHDETLAALKVPMATFAVVIVLIFLGPFFVFSGPLRRAKRVAELQYGALVGQQGRLVRQKWIERKTVIDEAGLLSAPELGPVADNISMFQMVDRMRSLPVGKRALISVIVPVAIPLLVVVSLKVPIKDVLLGLLKAIA